MAASALAIEPVLAVIVVVGTKSRPGASQRVPARRAEPAAIPGPPRTRHHNAVTTHGHPGIARTRRSQSPRTLNRSCTSSTRPAALRSTERADTAAGSRCTTLTGHHPYSAFRAHCPAAAAGPGFQARLLSVMTTPGTRGPGRGPGRRVIPARPVLPVRFPVSSVQPARTADGAVLMVRRRSTVRFRNGAPAHRRNSNETNRRRGTSRQRRSLTALTPIPPPRPAGITHGGVRPAAGMAGRWFPAAPERRAVRYPAGAP
jgi:hypothetical protein